MLHEETWREWDLGGLALSLLFFDHAFHMKIGSGADTLMVTIESEAQLRKPDEPSIVLNPATPRTMAPVLDLLHQPVAILRASSGGKLRISLADGTELWCEPDDRYEAWSTRGAGSLASASLMSGPGGGAPWAEA